MSQSQSTKQEIKNVIFLGFICGCFIGGPLLLAIFIHTPLLSERYRALLDSARVVEESALILGGLIGVIIALLIRMRRQSKRSLFDPNFWSYFRSQVRKTSRLQWFWAIVMIVCGVASTLLAGFIPVLGFMSVLTGVFAASYIFFQPQTRRTIAYLLVMVIFYWPTISFLSLIMHTRATPLHAAAHLGYPQLVLRWFGAIQAGDRRGKTPLHYAAIRNHSQAILILLNAGATINIRDKSGFTALHDAARYGSLQAVKTLVKSGARVEIGRITPVQYAAMNGHAEIVRYLLDVTPNISSESTTVLWYAIQYNWVETARVAIEKGADLSSEKSGKTLLNSARSQEMIKMLKKTQTDRI